MSGIAGEDAVLVAERDMVAVADLLPGFGNTWETWEEVERDVMSRLCLCCSLPGHHQEKMDRYVAEHGVDGLAICVVGREVHDGHHRVLAAKRNGVEWLPVESMDDAGARWVRDHGPVDWTRRRSGDMTKGEASWVVTDALMAVYGTRHIGSDARAVTSGDAGASSATRATVGQDSGSGGVTPGDESS